MPSKYIGLIKIRKQLYFIPFVFFAPNKNTIQIIFCALEAKSTKENIYLSALRYMNSMNKSFSSVISKIKQHGDTQMSESSEIDHIFKCLSVHINNNNNEKPLNSCVKNNNYIVLSSTCYMGQRFKGDACNACLTK